VIFSVIADGVGMEASIPIGQDVFGWWLMKTTGKNLGETVVVGQFA
jgi:hypothetical protein